MSVIHLFTGPTLETDAAVRLIPKGLAYGPARRGNLLHVGEPGDSVVIVDCDPYRPPRHDEILSLIASGIAVAGAGGWGAVLAADMEPYGMTGVGAVFSGLRDGSVADDEATGQGPGGKRDLQAYLSLAVARGVLTHDDARRIGGPDAASGGTLQWADLPRTADRDLGPSLRRFRAWMRHRLAIRQAGRSDAIKALRLASAGLLPSGPAPAAWRPAPPGSMALRQDPELCGLLPARLLPWALHCPEWRTRWYRFVLGRAGAAIDGLHPDELSPAQLGMWLSSSEIGLSVRERAERVLVRAAVRDARSPAWPVSRADADALTSGLPVPSSAVLPRGPFDLARLWQVPAADLDIAALDRGLDYPARALGGSGCLPA